MYCLGARSRGTTRRTTALRALGAREDLQAKSDSSRRGITDRERRTRTPLLKVSVQQSGAPVQSPGARQRLVGSGTQLRPPRASSRKTTPFSFATRVASETVAGLTSTTVRLASVPFTPAVRADSGVPLKVVLQQKGVTPAGQETCPAVGHWHEPRLQVSFTPKHSFEHAPQFYSWCEKGSGCEDDDRTHVRIRLQVRADAG